MPLSRILLRKPASFFSKYVSFYCDIFIFFVRQRLRNMSLQSRPVFIDTPYISWWYQFIFTTEPWRKQRFLAKLSDKPPTKPTLRTGARALQEVLGVTQAQWLVQNFSSAGHNATGSAIGQYIGWNDVTKSTATIRSPFCGYDMA